MKGVVLLGILTLVLIAGCVETTYDRGNNEKQTHVSENTQSYEDGFGYVEQEQTKQIIISGVDKTQEISSHIPVDLVISGVGHYITIKEGTEVSSIFMSGIDIVVMLPEGSNPKITDSGVDNQIKYY